jgi:hypothetical protein
MENSSNKVTNSGQQQGAQMIYLAQLNAAKGTCKCAACQLLRKGNDLMTKDALGSAAGQADQLKQALESVAGGEELVGETVEV